MALLSNPVRRSGESPQASTLSPWEGSRIRLGWVECGRHFDAEKFALGEAIFETAS
ncbi:hypothetical protein IU427_14905 [Nocardia beijingensis]|uniref:hypothetical protein n=1 Tax=Nocardia beijingensis TaxID=95162 RepID=UPI0018954EC1|nr:hypothetical protein [Nocardia beijingensis]MBF6466458.1 hypothetical protein [Nocardia beijingensis]